MRKKRTKFNYRFYISNDNVVVALSTYAGKTVRGVAKCAPEDTFSLEKGKKLAVARCNEKIALKRWKNARRRFDAAKKELDAAQRHFNAMYKYFDEAGAALGKARLDRADIEDSLR